MKALTIQQPWASAIIAGIKDIENRNWATYYTGPLAIHAGKAFFRNPIHENVMKILEKLGPLEELPRGVILGVVDFKGCFDHKRPFLATNPFAFGPVCWKLENPRALAEPIPYRGKQGLWTLPDEIMEGKL